MSLAIENKPDLAVSMLTCYARNVRSLLPHKIYFTIKFTICQYFIFFSDRIAQETRNFVNLTKTEEKYLQQCSENQQKVFAFFNKMCYNIGVEVYS